MSDDTRVIAMVPVREDSHIYIRNGHSSTGQHRDRRKFAKAYSTAWQSVFASRLFTPQESHTLLFLGAYCEADSNAVVDEDGPMSLRRVAKELGWSEKNMRRIIRSLQSKNAIFYGGESGDERFFVNPALFGKGSAINATTQRMFDDRKHNLMAEASGMLSFLRIGRSESNILSSVHGK